MTYDRLAAETASDKNLFDFDMSEETRQRILSLRSDSQRLWGKMTVAQTLAHCTAGVEMATEERRELFPEGEHRRALAQNRRASNTPELETEMLQSNRRGRSER